MSVTLTLDKVRARTAEELIGGGGPCADYADLELTGADALAGWVGECAGKIARAEFVIPPMDGTPDTLFLSLNDVVWNPDGWFLSPMAYAWADRGDEVEVGELFDGVVGHEVGDVQAPAFALQGLEPLQRVIADAVDGELAGRWVVASVMALVHEALQRAPDIHLRVALSRSDEPLVALWEHEGGALSCVVHAEGAPWE